MDRVAGMKVDMEVDLVVVKVANMKVDKVAGMVPDMKVHKVADMVADMKVTFFGFFGDIFWISR